MRIKKNAWNVNEETLHLVELWEHSRIIVTLATFLKIFIIITVRNAFSH